MVGLVADRRGLRNRDEAASLGGQRGDADRQHGRQDGEAAQHEGGDLGPAAAPDPEAGPH